ncbi:MAG: FAD-dependent oxidoreductase [Chloroflexota bacterium]
MTTHCCIVGGGPGGMILAYLLARRGIDVLLLEEHRDFDRDFRGDTIHPSTMELLDRLGLAERLLQLRHSKIDRLTLSSKTGTVAEIDLGRLRTRFPYITMMPQAQLLDFLATEASQFPNFHLRLGANVQEQIREDGVVRGIRYRAQDGWHDVRAPLTVGADGRFSRMRRLAAIESTSTAPPMDVLWLRVPRLPDDPHGGLGRIGNGHLVVMLDRDQEWQLGFVIPKGGYREIHEAGIERLRSSIAEIVPELTHRLETINTWQQVSLLSVESSRAKTWYQPGLLLIGDAAHVMSPVGGVGINYAVQDAVVAANVLTEPLLRGRIRLRDLAAVQRQREWPVRVIQAIQAQIQQRVISNVLRSNEVPAVPLIMRLPLIRDIPARAIAYGIRPVHLNM